MKLTNTAPKGASTDCSHKPVPEMVHYKGQNRFVSDYKPRLTPVPVKSPEGQDPNGDTTIVPIADSPKGS